MTMPSSTSFTNLCRSVPRILVTLLACAVITVASSAAETDAPGASRQSKIFERIGPVVSRSVVMVKVAAYPQARLKGVIQPPRHSALRLPAIPELSSLLWRCSVQPSS